MKKVFISLEYDDGKTTIQMSGGRKDIISLFITALKTNGEFEYIVKNSISILVDNEKEINNIFKDKNV